MATHSIDVIVMEARSRGGQTHGIAAALIVKGGLSLVLLKALVKREIDAHLLAEYVKLEYFTLIVGPDIQTVCHELVEDIETGAFESWRRAMRQ